MKITDVVNAQQFTIEDIKTVLSISPDDELYTVQELSEKFNIGESTIKASRALLPYRTKFNGRNYFGSAEAIQRLTLQVTK